MHLHLLWTVFTSLSLVPITVGVMGTASQESVSVTWDTQVTILSNVSYVFLHFSVQITLSVNLLCVHSSVEQDRCVPSVPSPSELTEDFEGKLSPLWQRISGGHIGGGCGTISEGKALYFSSSGQREARTVPLDTTSTR